MALILNPASSGQGPRGRARGKQPAHAGVANKLYLADINAQKLESECQDLTDSMSFYPHNCRVVNCGESGFSPAATRGGQRRR